MNQVGKYCSGPLKKTPLRFRKKCTMVPTPRVQPVMKNERRLSLVLFKAGFNQMIIVTGKIKQVIENSIKKRNTDAYSVNSKPIEKPSAISLILFK